MGIWFRSQDKEKLLDVNFTRIDNNCKKTFYIVDDEYNVLGEYSSKEKALKVLDEIEKAITGYCYTTDGWANEYEKEFRQFEELPRYETTEIPPKPIYHMPKDEDVE